MILVPPLLLPPLPLGGNRSSSTKADPLKVLDKVQKKSHRQVELLIPVPKAPAEEPKKDEENKENVKPEEKKRRG
uniref:Uncharacterized protein n=1 Tax=Nelumbo nucifera TaxID=4432 RepID=A0A822ZVY7_NELNU|nr:TPA_asm: hypothetical protein HUJ06_019110 [Nelumbo nucifera]